ncbi:MAG: hypothetical protein Q7S72_00545 [Candidatus Taylorbacteria bacterium]|nr:hypothetical protein [Candidatus Taylorbacteria bacterium]
MSTLSPFEGQPGHGETGWQVVEDGWEKFKFWNRDVGPGRWVTPTEFEYLQQEKRELRASRTVSPC